MSGPVWKQRLLQVMDMVAAGFAWSQTVSRSRTGLWCVGLFYSCICFLISVMVCVVKDNYLMCL